MMLRWLPLLIAAPATWLLKSGAVQRVHLGGLLDFLNWGGGRGELQVDDVRIDHLDALVQMFRSNGPAPLGLARVALA
jgi:hypothetical protein